MAAGHAGWGADNLCHFSAPLTWPRTCPLPASPRCLFLPRAQKWNLGGFVLLNKENQVKVAQAFFIIGKVLWTSGVIVTFSVATATYLTPLPICIKFYLKKAICWIQFVSGDGTSMWPRTVSCPETSLHIHASEWGPCLCGSSWKGAGRCCELNCGVP
jgi:hypothetical protein